MHNTPQTIRRVIVCVTLLAALALITSPPNASGQEFRLLTYTREYNAVVGYDLTCAITNYGPESWQYRTKISVDWNRSGAGHNTRSFFSDPIYGGAGSQERPKGSTETIDYIRDEWPALPDFGTNSVYFGLNSNFSNSLLTNTAPVDNRSGSEFRYARYTNDTTQSDSYIVGVDENNDPIIVYTVNTNYVSETASWTAEFLPGGEPGSTNTRLWAIILQPTDDNGDFVTPSDISFGTNTLDSLWTTYTVFADNTTNSVTPAFAQAVTVAKGAPQLLSVAIDFEIRFSGEVPTNNPFWQSLCSLFGTNAQGDQITPTLGGPIALNPGALNMIPPFTVNHAVDYTAFIPLHVNPVADCRYKQTVMSDIMYFSYSDTTLGTNYIIPAGAGQPDGIPTAIMPGILPNTQSRTIVSFDAPGPSVGVFTYFGQTPPAGPNQPPGTTVCSITRRYEFETWVEFKNITSSTVKKWFFEITTTGDTISNVSTSAGYR